MQGRRASGPIRTPAAGWGLLLGTGTLGLQWLDHERFTRFQPAEITIFLVAGAILVAGIVIGIHLFAPRAPAPREDAPEPPPEPRE